MLALFASVIAISVLAAGRRARRILVASAALAAVATLGAVVAVAANDSLRKATSGRSDLVENTAYVIADNPLTGVGIGGEEKASREEGEERGLLPKPSHTTPLTVAAELGLVGLAAYALLLWSMGRGLLRLHRLDRVLAVSLAAVLVVLLVHSLFYSGFFEDPLTWGALGLVAAGLAGGTSPTSRPRQA
jgi:O-antigen ligase